jgi:hypothetical protein
LTLAAVASVAALLAGSAAAVADPLPIQVTFNPNPTAPTAPMTETWTVPAGVTEVTFYADGGAGGAGGDEGGNGGKGGSIQANFAVMPGQVYDITVGGNGADGKSAATGGAGGTGGGPGGGTGAGGPTTPVLGGGGGGGGQSAIALAGTTNTPVLVAPGGGGGGGGNGTSPTLANGGDGGQPGDANTVSNAGGGGAGSSSQGGTAGTGTSSALTGGAGSQNHGANATAGGSAGGGGDGYYGGGSGGGAPGDGAGGGGGGGFFSGAGATEPEELGGSSIGLVSIGYTLAASTPPPVAATPPPAVVPHASIGGVAALGQVLTCNPGVSSAGTTFTYQWLRDALPVPAAIQSTYLAGAADGGSFLQCVATAVSPGGTESSTSAFAAVPEQGTGATIAQTAVGTVRPHGAQSSAVLFCSPYAAGACAITLTLTSVETFSGSRVVSATALARGPLTKAQKTVTVGTRSVTVAPGKSDTVLVSLNVVATRLIATRHRLPVSLTVSGTLVGAKRGLLRKAHYTLHATSGSTPVAPTGESAALPATPLAATPYMGWDSYYALGGGAAVNETSILAQAHELISRGLVKLGYRYVWLDVGWWQGARTASGQISVSATKWPHGIAWLASTLHKEGLMIGLYTDAGSVGCGGAGQGSYGHYQQDVNTFATWGIDAIKVDFCGGVRLSLVPQAAYTAFHQAILDDAPHRPMLLNVCNFLQPGQFAAGNPVFGGSSFVSYLFGPAVATSWRTDTDLGTPQRVNFAGVLRNMDADATHPAAAGPGHWNDPDYLAPDQGMNKTQFQSQVSMWAMLAAPLMISDNLQTITSASLASLSNPEVIAIDQDPAGVQGTWVASSGAAEVFVKRLSDGSRAVALLNRGSAPLTITASAGGVGMSAASSYQLRNVWTHSTTSSTGTISATVPADGTVLYRVSVTPRAAAAAK